MRRALITLLLAGAAVAEVSAQGTCEVTPIGNTLTTRIGGTTYVSGRARYDCTGDVHVVADSAVNVVGGGVLLLIGRVSYSDPEKTLTASRIDYHGRVGRLVAQGDVLVTDKKNGTILRAPQGLEYIKASRENPDNRINVYTGRPHIKLFKDSAGIKKDTTDVDADRMEIVGEKYFHGTGNVIIVRGDLDARGGEAILEDSGNRINLWRIAKIKTADYTLDADSVYGETEADEFKELRAFRAAKLDSEDIDVDADRLRIMFDSGVVNRLVAVGLREAGGTAAKQARVNTEEFLLTADSVDALTPKQQLERVTAIGRAEGIRTADSLDLALPELVRRDWLKGDTVIALFVEASDSIKRERRAQKDTTNNRVMERLIAAGAEQPATALYRMREEGDTTRTPQINYIAAKRIVAIFKDGEVHDVDARPEVRGLYLQPIKKAEPARPPGGPR